jgi:hypothetical protein
MSFPTPLAIARGLPGTRVIRQFGRNTAVGATFATVSRGGVYQTPQAATALRIKAGGNANDTAAGTGARAVTMIGIDATGDLVSDTVATAGASASGLTSKLFLRLFDAFVSASGTYASQSAQSHAGTIVIENGAGGTDWATIPDTDIARGETEIGSITVPKDRTSFITNVRLQSPDGKKSNIVMFNRQNILQSAAPYSAMRLIEEFPNFTGFATFDYDPPIRLPELTDFGFLAKAESGTIDIAVAFEGFEVAP